MLSSRRARLPSAVMQRDSISMSASTRLSRRVRSQRAPLATGVDSSHGLCGPSCKHDDCSSRGMSIPRRASWRGALLPILRLTEEAKGRRDIHDVASSRDEASSVSPEVTIGGSRSDPRGRPGWDEIHVSATRIRSHSMIAHRIERLLWPRYPTRAPKSRVEPANRYQVPPRDASIPDVCSLPSFDFQRRAPGWCHARYPILVEVG